MYPFPKTYLLDVCGRWSIMVREKISIYRGGMYTAGAWRMEIDRNRNLLDRDFYTIPLPLTTMAGYAIKSSKWLALSRYKKYGQKERGKK